MTQHLEDRLRAAFREKADQVPPAAPPLELTQPRRAARPGGIRVPGGWLTPGQRRLAAGLAAAAAVAAIAVGAVVASAPSAPPAPAQPAPPKNLPPYYVALAQSSTGSSDHAVAVVRATRTGAVVARIAVPRPYTDFSGVTAAADDRTFILGAVSWTDSSVPQKFFLLRIDPGAHLAASRARLTPLGIRLPSGSGAVGMALSPDSTSLAVVATSAGSGDIADYGIIIYNLSTGASHSWEARNCPDHCIIDAIAGEQHEMNTISWTADGRQLGFVLNTGAAGQTQFRLLNVSAPGNDVLADSHLVTLRAAPGALRGAAPGHLNWGISLITPDGGSVIINTANPRVSAPPGPPQTPFSQYLLRYSTRTGALQRVLGVQRSQARNRHPLQVLWTSPDGSKILVTGFKGAYTSAGLLHDGHYTPIPWSRLTISAAW